MSTTTPNRSLVKAVDADAADLKVFINQNMDILDIHTHTETTVSFAGKSGKQYVDDADNVIMNTKMAGLTLWKGTQAAYDLLTKDPNTLYFISG